MNLTGSVGNNPVRRDASRAKVMEDIFWEKRRDVAASGEQCQTGSLQSGKWNAAVAAVACAVPVSPGSDIASFVEVKVKARENECPRPVPC